MKFYNVETPFPVNSYERNLTEKMRPHSVKMY